MHVPPGAYLHSKEIAGPEDFFSTHPPSSSISLAGSSSAPVEREPSRPQADDAAELSLPRAPAGNAQERSSQLSPRTPGPGMAPFPSIGFVIDPHTPSVHHGPADLSSMASSDLSNLSVAPGKHDESSCAVIYTECRLLHRSWPSGRDTRSHGRSRRGTSPR